MSETHRGVRLEYLGASFTDAELRRVFAETGSMLEFFEERAGVRYPGRSYTQVLAAGRVEQEVGLFTLLSESYGRRLLDDDPRDLWLMAHELAHQWWGNSVTCRDWNHFWLNEGLATFLADAYLERRFGPEVYAKQIAGARDDYERVRDKGGDKALVFPDWLKPSADDRVIVYRKGAYVLHLLRESLGETLFWAGLRDYTRRHMGGSVTTGDFQKAMEESTGRDLDAFFERWVYSAGGELGAYRIGGGFRESSIAAMAPRAGSLPQLVECQRRRDAGRAWHATCSISLQFSAGGVPDDGGSLDGLDCAGRGRAGPQQRVPRPASRPDALLFREHRRAPRAGAGAGRERRAVRAPRPAGAAPAEKAAALALFGASALGLVLMVTGTTRPYRPLLWVHMALAATGALVLVARAAAGAYAWLPKGAWIRELAILSFAAAALTPAFRYHADHLAPNGRRIVNPALPPLSMEGEGAGPSSPFFPSSSDTNTRTTIPANFFMTSQTCAKCHKDIYDQWNASAHHFSSFNNQWYRKSIEYMQDVVGTKPSKWCAGCHDHAVFFNGRFDRPIKEQIDTPEAQNGLGCTSCHSIVHVRSTMGQGDFEIEYPPLHDLAVSENPVLAWTHDYLLKLDPAPHRRVFLKDFHREQTADFCSSCHKVHLDVPVNDYRWFRGFNDYDNWQASGMSGQGARSFYYPPKPQRCADCHMPLVAVERSRGEGRQGALAPLPRGQHGAAVRERRPRAAARHAGVPEGQRRERRHLRAGAGRGPGSARRGAPGGGRRAAARRAPSRSGKRAATWARPRACCATRRRSWRRSARWTRRCAAASRRAWTWWCARARSATSSRAAPSTRSTCGWSSRRSTRTAGRSSTAARCWTAGRGRSSRARTSTAA